VRELLDEFPGEALRLAILSAHYRQPLDFTKEKVVQARQTLDRWYGVLRAAGDVPTGDIPAEFMAALTDDLNTPLAISVLHELANAYHKAGDDAARLAAASGLKAATNLMGLLNQPPEAWFKWQPAGASGLNDAAIEQAIADRLAARKAKNFAEADRIRNDLAAQGVILEDGPKGTSWKRG